MSDIINPKYAGKEAGDDGLPNLDGYPLNFNGGKKRMLKEIAARIPDGVLTIADPFGGTGIVSHYCKHYGYRTLTGDVLRYTNLCHKVLLSNNDTVLSKDEVELLLRPNPNRSNHFAEHYRRALGEDVCDLLDSAIINISEMGNAVKRDLAVFLVVACIRKRIKPGQIHFTSKNVIAGVASDKFIGLDNAIRSYATEVFPKFVINRGTDCKVFREDAVSLIPKIQADLLYLDPPYSGTLGDYEASYAMLDDLIVALNGDADQIVNLCDSRCELEPYTYFGKREAALKGFYSLFEASQHIPHVLLSYNDTSSVGVDEIADIASLFRIVKKIDKIPMRLPKSQKVNHEILMLLE